MSPSQAQTFPDMWVDPQDDPRDRDQIEVVDERTNLQEYLRVYRITLRMKTDGLTRSSWRPGRCRRRRCRCSGWSGHLAKVERDWFHLRAAGQDGPRIYWSEATRTRRSAARSPTSRSSRRRSPTGSGDRLRRGVRAGAPRPREVYTLPGDDTISLRELLLHMVEEYARHCGHADLLRECVDGRTGQ